MIIITNCLEFQVNKDILCTYIVFNKPEKTNLNFASQVIPIFWHQAVKQSLR